MGSSLLTALPASSLSPSSPFSAQMRVHTYCSVTSPCTENKTHILFWIPLSSHKGGIRASNLVSLLAEIVSAAQMAWPWPRGRGVLGGRALSRLPTFFFSSPPTSLHSSYVGFSLYPLLHCVTSAQPLPFSGSSFLDNCRKGAPNLCPTSPVLLGFSLTHSFLPCVLPRT